MEEKNRKSDIFSVDGIEIPYYHFNYEGEFYKYLRIRNNKLLGDGTRINEFFQKRSYEHYDFEGDFSVINRGIMIIIHYFADLSKRDLDNNSYKPLIDGIKKTGIIRDDSWQNLSLMFIGGVVSTKDVHERIEVFVIPHEYFREFLSVNTINSIILESNKTVYSSQKEEIRLSEKVEWAW